MASLSITPNWTYLECWKVPIASGEATQILAQGWAGGWALTDQGICFRGTREDDGSAGPAIKFYAFETRHVTQVTEFSRDVMILDSSNNPLSISPAPARTDGKDTGNGQ